MEPGKFISIEGGEGVGKSTVIKALKERLNQRGIDVVSTREPGGTSTGKQIRSLFLDPKNGTTLAPKTDLFLMAADRAQHIAEVINPALERGAWVLCDRFFDSTRVYQGDLNGVSPSQLETVLEICVGERQPHLTLLLDCDVDILLARVRSRSSETGATDESRFDQSSRNSHEKIRDGFKKLMDRFPNRVKLVDAAQQQSDVVKDAWQQIERHFKFNG